MGPLPPAPAVPAPPDPFELVPPEPVPAPPEPLLVPPVPAPPLPSLLSPLELQPAAARPATLSEARRRAGRSKLKDAEDNEPKGAEGLFILTLRSPLREENCQRTEGQDPQFSQFFRAHGTLLTSHCESRALQATCKRPWGSIRKVATYGHLPRIVAEKTRIRHIPTAASAGRRKTSDNSAGATHLFAIVSRSGPARSRERRAARASDNAEPVVRDAGRPNRVRLDNSDDKAHTTHAASISCELEPTKSYLG